MSNIQEYSVTELSLSLKEKLEAEYSRIKVRGEISGLKDWNGHLLFNLKDENSLLSARIWQNRTRFLKLNPEEGLEIIALGKISAHIQRSNYNFIIENIELAGEGALLKLIEERKNKFRSLGYFKDNLKLSLPFLPDKIGIITSLTGSVIEDIKTRIRERFPSHLVIWPVSVQGLKAEREISLAIKGFNELNNKPDLIILARGGGSIEDLMPFNSETVIQAIHNSDIPIISAVGHETDYSLSDLVADIRASTPTAAADIIVPEKKDLHLRLNNNEETLKSFLENLIEKKNYKVKALGAKIIEPSMLLKILKTNYEEKFLKIKENIFNLIKLNKNSLNKIIIKKPHFHLNLCNEKYYYLSNLLQQNIKKYFKTKLSILEGQIRVLESCSYQRLLEKGFTIIKSFKGEVIKSTKDIKEKNDIKIIFKDGEVEANVEKVSNKKNIN